MCNRRKASLAVVAGLMVAGVVLWWGWNQGWWFTGGERAPRSAVELRDGLLRLKTVTGPFTGVMFEQAQGGGLLNEVPVWRGKVHGIARGWHPNGQLEVEEHFINGLSDGVRTRWHPNGVKRSTTTIVKGVLNGPYVEWHDNGRKALEMTLVNGLGEGPSESWYPDGRLKSKVVLKAGEPIRVEQAEPAK